MVERDGDRQGSQRPGGAGSLGAVAGAEPGGEKGGGGKGRMWEPAHQSHRDANPLVAADGARGDDLHRVNLREVGDQRVSEALGKARGTQARSERLEGDDRQGGDAGAALQESRRYVKLPVDQPGESGQCGYPGDTQPAPACCRRWRGRLGGYEAVSAAWNGLDVRRLRAFVAECFAKDGDVAREAYVLYNGIGPDQLHKVGFFHRAAATFDEGVQSVDGFRRQRRHFAVAE